MYIMCIYIYTYCEYIYIYTHVVMWYSSIPNLRTFFVTFFLSRSMILLYSLSGSHGQSSFGAGLWS